MDAVAVFEKYVQMPVLPQARVKQLSTVYKREHCTSSMQLLQHLLFFEPVHVPFMCY